MLCCALWLALASCGDTGQAQVEIALYGQGSALAEGLVHGATFRLTRADVAFGPAYFCASKAAEPEPCETALAEMRNTVVISGVSATPTRLGELRGTTGHVHSAFYDYGIVFLLTHDAPMAIAGAPGGHSAVLEGTVERAGEMRRFQARVDMEPAVPGATVVSAQPTEHELSGDGDALTVSLDPYAWLADIDVDALFALPVDAQGITQISDESQAYEAILQGLRESAPARSVWSQEP
jgi:hypothetical protein